MVSLMSSNIWPLRVISSLGNKNKPHGVKLDYGECDTTGIFLNVKHFHMDSAEYGYDAKAMTDFHFDSGFLQHTFSLNIFKTRL